MEFLPAPDRPDPPAAEVHVWRADLDRPRWPGAEGLPEDERRRAEAFLRPLPQKRWIAARWALRAALGRYLGQPPAAIRLVAGEHGKPRLERLAGGLAFNLSHSDRLALIAVAAGHEVGVDVERVAGKHPQGFYERWTEHEARVKCLGVGLTGVAPGAGPEIEVRRLDLGAEFAASVAAASAVGAVRGWTLDPPHRRPVLGVSYF
ncbi:MAG TPA: hypothetical protein VF125_07930 [Solirubrobacterales bacterium]